MNIDTVVLRADLLVLAHDLLALKKLLGATWVRPMKEEQHRLARLRRRATELHVLLAFSRGKKHTKEDETWHAKVATRVANDYLLAEDLAS